jgi:hypothetical protein
MNQALSTPSPGQPAEREVPAPSGASPVVRGLRLALTALVVIVGCYLGYGLGKFWAEWRRANHPVVTRDAEATDLGPLSAALPLDGPWSFDELDWNLRSQLIPGSEVEAQLESLAASAPAQPAEQLPDTDPALLDLVASLQIRPVEQAGNEVYRLNRSDIKAALVARDVGGRKKTVAFAVAYPQLGDQWQLFACTPRDAAQSTSARSDEHLLPLPPGARRTSGRFADDGQPLLEFVSLESSAHDLLASWKAAGWEVRPSGFADPADFSYLCARGDDVVYAWSADGPDSLENLMLVRTPTPADTSP